MRVKKQLDARYNNLFGRVAGYLPTDRGAVDLWQKNLLKELAKARKKGEEKEMTPGVRALAALLEQDGIARMYVTQMIEEVPRRYRQIQTVEELLAALNHIITTAPLYNPDPKKGNFFPMSSLFTYMMMTRSGEAAFRYGPFNDALRGILKEWCQFLDSPESRYVLNRGKYGWLSKSAWAYNKLYEFVIPDPAGEHGGFASFNAYFHREIKAECRPITDPHDKKVIVSANDGTVYKIARNVKRQDRFWLKGQPYSLEDMLTLSPETAPLIDRFVGGDVFQSFLSGADYHRWRAPVAGKVHYAKVVDGLMFSDAESAGVDTTAGTYSQGYEASVNTRGLVFIDSGDAAIGMVCVMPIGITEISSVTITVEQGQEVSKGAELGYFSYGGSSMCLVFQPGAIQRFTVKNRRPGTNPDAGPAIQVNAQIAVAN